MDGHKVLLWCCGLYHDQPKREGNSGLPGASPVASTSLPLNAAASGAGAPLTCQLHAGAPRQGPPHQLPQVLGLGVPPEPVYQPVGAVLHQDDLVVWPQPLLGDASKVAAAGRGAGGGGQGQGRSRQVSWTAWVPSSRAMLRGRQATCQRCCTCSAACSTCTACVPPTRPPVLPAYCPHAHLYCLRTAHPPTCTGTCQCRPPAPGPAQTTTTHGAAAPQSKTSPAGGRAGKHAWWQPVGMVAGAADPPLLTDNKPVPSASTANCAHSCCLCTLLPACLPARPPASAPGA